jgi:hypothetical protein
MLLLRGRTYDTRFGPTFGLDIKFKPQPVWSSTWSEPGATEQERGARNSLTSSERKTGVKHTKVITARLVHDDRGWLRLAG